MLGWAGAHFHVVASAYFVPKGQVAFGTLRSARVTDLKEPLLLKALKAGVLPHAYQAVLAPGAATVAFAHGSDYLQLMSEVTGAPVVQGSDLRVEISGRDDRWHDFASKTHLWMANREQERKGGKLVRIEDHPQDGQQEARKTYIFPDLKTMAAFCDYVDSGRIDELMTSFLRKTANTPSANP
jgi:hypothetical protein